MAQKGSRLNPYSCYEYSSLKASGDWRGGWATSKSAAKIFYIAADHTEISGYMYGSFDRPIIFSYYENLKYQGLWTGGWVLTNSLEPAENLVYYTAGGQTVSKTTGTEYNPFTSAIFNEMCLNEIWIGGWVRFENGDVKLVPKDSHNGGDGSGSGSESGSGSSGSGSGSGGNGYVIPGIACIPFPGVFIDISWEAGLAAPGGTRITAKPAIARAEWTALYTMKITVVNSGFSGESTTYIVPEIFRE